MTHDDVMLLVKAIEGLGDSLWWVCFWLFIVALK